MILTLKILILCSEHHREIALSIPPPMLDKTVFINAQEREEVTSLRAADLAISQTDEPGGSSLGASEQWPARSGFCPTEYDLAI